jgi:hypothetical protein
VVGVLQVVSEKTAPVNGAEGTGDSPGPPQLVEPVTFVNLSDSGPGCVVVVVAGDVVVVAASVVVVAAAVDVVAAPVVDVVAAVVVLVVAPAVVVVVAPAVVLVVAPAVVLVVAPAVVEVVAAVVVLVVAPGAVLVVVADGTVVVVLPGGGHVPDAPHASQQLDTDPTHAVPPAGARQAASLRLMAQRVVPLAPVRQQVTKPGLPHADFAAQPTTASRHASRSDPLRTAALTARDTQLT